ncbi:MULTISPECIES: VOC family protein [Paenibacillus]|uniref:VOC family protein n=1 Tax=Paenibacillus TaxID=44249 RepID=UPI000838DB95|nr:MULTISPECIES: VOC family protein [Paenibacillus]GIP22643.1 glyoxalase [Paenibacillus sp. J22TS3]
MILNHLNLTVTDVTAAKDFLVKYFGLRCLNTRGNAFALLNDDNQIILTLMKGSEVHYPETFHIGFTQESEAVVDQINQRLKEDGYDVNPPKHAHGYTFYVKAPGGFTVEVVS